MIRSTLQRYGFAPRSASPSLLFYGGGREAFEGVAPLLDALLNANQRMTIHLCAKDEALAGWLEATFPQMQTVRPPASHDFAAVMFLKRLRVRALILLEEELFPSQAILNGLRKRSISIVLLSGRGRARLKTHLPPEEGAEILLAADSEPGPDSARESRLTLAPSTVPGGMDQTAAKALLEKLIPLLGKNRKWVNRRDRPLRRMVGRWLHRRLDDPGFASRYARFLRRYDDVAAVREALGQPDTILCLGNGPSSEDPGLADIAYDSLFRVNHSWMDRSVLTDADVVFTGGHSTMSVLKDPIFGLQHQTGEMVLLSTRGPFALRHPFRYFSMERLGPYLDDFDWGDHRPTNGAAMIAMAAALQPKRLVIAGIDLFRHPDGGYPGDKTTPNAYTPAHSGDKELSFICHSLDRLQGEVVIFGEILDREWRRFRERHQHHLDEVG